MGFSFTSVVSGTCLYNLVFLETHQVFIRVSQLAIYFLIVFSEAWWKRELTVQLFKEWCHIGWRWQCYFFPGDRVL